MSENNNARDPLEFVSNMWNNMGFSLPGVITPTLDVDELDKRIHDLKTVEHWLKVNLNMVQMTTQGLEMQRATLAAVKAMSESTGFGRDEKQPEPGPENPFASAAGLWPWNFINPQQPSKEDPRPKEKTTKTKPRADSTGQTEGKEDSKPTGKKD